MELISEPNKGPSLPLYTNDPATMDNNNSQTQRRTTKRAMAGANQLPMSFCLSTGRVQSLVIPFIVAIIFLLTQIVPISYQQLNNLCPRNCTCDDKNLEVLCKYPSGMSGFPHTLNPSIKKISINNAPMNQLTGLDIYDKLTTLDMSQNKFTIIDFGMTVKNTYLASINSSQNLIVELQDTLVSKFFNDLNLKATTFNPDGTDQSIYSTSFKKMSKMSVTELILAHNQLKILKNYTFIRFCKLERLDLSHNRIETIEAESLFGLEKLETINLRGNQLKQIPTQALQRTMHILTANPSNVNPSSLKLLDLSENNFFSIESDAFNKLEKAQTILLESCSIHEIQEQAFNGLYTLNLLALDRNNLQEIPTDSFKYLGMLRVLRLNSNNFSSIHPNSFSGLANLEQLQISDVPLKDLTRGVFEGLDSLEELEITNNPSLTKIGRGTFDNLKKLKLLDLKSNGLTTLPDIVYNRVPILDLRANPIHCMCETKWITGWLKKFNETIQSLQPINYGDSGVSYSHHQNFSKSEIVQYQMEGYLTTDLLNLTCFGPPALVGKPIIGLPENKLECLEPSSELNVHIGFITLLCMTTLLTLVCLFNCCRNKKHLFVMLKENLVQNHLTMVLPYSQTHLRSNVDELKKETQLYGSNYEPVEQANQRRPQPSLGPAYSVLSDQFMYYEPQPYSQYI